MFTVFTDEKPPTPSFCPWRVYPHVRVESVTLGCSQGRRKHNVTHTRCHSDYSVAPGSDHVVYAGGLAAHFAGAGYNRDRGAPRRGTARAACWAGGLIWPPCVWLLRLQNEKFPIRPGVCQVGDNHRKIIRRAQPDGVGLNRVSKLTELIPAHRPQAAVGFDEQAVVRSRCDRDDSGANDLFGKKGQLGDGAYLEHLLRF